MGGRGEREDVEGIGVLFLLTLSLNIVVWVGSPIFPPATESRSSSVYKTKAGQKVGMNFSCFVFI